MSEQAGGWGWVTENLSTSETSEKLIFTFEESYLQGGT